MASTVPAKSQPLHNFTLPHLKWNKDGHSSGHHVRRRSSVNSPSRRPSTSSASPVRNSPLRDSAATTAAASPRRSPAQGDHLGKQSPGPGESSKPYPVREWAKHSPIGGDLVRHSPSRDSASESEASGRGKGATIEYRRNHSKNLALDGVKNGLYSTNSVPQKFETKSKGKEVDIAGSKRSKILIKIPCKSNKAEEENLQEEPQKIENNDEDEQTDEVQEEGKINNNLDEEIKTWNLRPRKPIRKSLNVNGSIVRNNGSSMPEKNKAQSPLRNLNNKSGEKEGNCSVGEKKEKRKLSISIALTKDEIEEDIFALTGSKPARRPKKRVKNIQKQVDAAFPGLWLVSITADSYKVSENSLKG